MFRKAIIALLLGNPVAGLAHTLHISVVYRQLDGKPYSKVRGFLLAHGNKPLDFRSSIRDCDFQPELCRYTEFESCWADEPECLLIWKTKDGNFLHVEIENPADRPGAPVGVITKENED